MASMRWPVARMLKTRQDQYCWCTHSVTIKGAQIPRAVLMRPFEPARIYRPSQRTAFIEGPQSSQRVVSVNRSQRFSGEVVMTRLTVIKGKAIFNMASGLSGFFTVWGFLLFYAAVREYFGPLFPEFFEAPVAPGWRKLSVRCPGQCPDWMNCREWGHRW